MREIGQPGWRGEWRFNPETPADPDALAYFNAAGAGVTNKEWIGRLGKALIGYGFGGRILRTVSPGTQRPSRACLTGKAGTPRMLCVSSSCSNSTDCAAISYTMMTTALICWPSDMAVSLIRIKPTCFGMAIFFSWVKTSRSRIQ